MALLVINFDHEDRPRTVSDDSGVVPKKIQIGLIWFII